MATFSERMRALRKEKEISLEKLAEIMKTTKATLSRYENDKRIPNIEFIQELAKVFNVSVDYLLGKSDIRNPEKIVQDKLTEKDKKDIAKDLEKMMNDLEHADGLMFYNEPITEEDRELLRQALEFGLRMAKIKNKEKYTPKKYRK